MTVCKCRHDFVLSKQFSSPGNAFEMEACTLLLAFLKMTSFMNIRMGGNAKVFALHGGNHGQTFFSSHLYAFKEKKSIAL